MSNDDPMQGDAMAVDSDDEMVDAVLTAPGGQQAQPPTADAAMEGAGAASSAAPGQPPDEQGSNEADAVRSKRLAIQQIMKDRTLTDLERRLRIQALMDGTASAIAAAQPGSAGTPVLADTSSVASSVVAGSITANSVHAGAGALGGGLADDAISCVHYERRCNVIAPCCGKAFGCRVCHDEMTPPPGHGPMDRFAIREVVCKDCKTRQPTSNRCVNCQVQFGEYHCDICNLWMVESKRPFHCADCGFCRVGGRDSFRHCHQCCMCISVNVYDDHNCMKDKYKNNCPVCREDMFSSRQSPQDLPCGHAIHAHCFRKLAGFDYRCPICKKTVVSQQSMAAAWATRARDIEMQPMPADLARVVNIMCNDCETKSTQLNWHFLGVQCPGCTSFNTVVEQVISSGNGEDLPPQNAGSG